MWVITRHQFGISTFFHEETARKFGCFLRLAVGAISHLLAGADFPHTRTAVLCVALRDDTKNGFVADQFILVYCPISEKNKYYAQLLIVVEHQL